MTLSQTNPSGVQGDPSLSWQLCFCLWSIWLSVSAQHGHMTGGWALYMMTHPCQHASRERLLLVSPGGSRTVKMGFLFLKRHTRLSQLIFNNHIFVDRVLWAWPPLCFAHTTHKKVNYTITTCPYRILCIRFGGTKMGKHSIICCLLLWPGFARKCMWTQANRHGRSLKALSKESCLLYNTGSSFQ